METTSQTPVTASVIVNAPVAKVWKTWTSPEDIMKWNNASDDWHTTRAENDLRTGGQFMSTMAAKDGSMSFDFAGTYTNVSENESIEYVMADGRKVSIQFKETENGTEVTESFDPEETHPRDFQQAGWQAILDNFKKYTEAA